MSDLRDLDKGVTPTLLVGEFLDAKSGNFNSKFEVF